MIKNKLRITNGKQLLESKIKRIRYYWDWQDYKVDVNSMLGIPMGYNCFETETLINPIVTIDVTNYKNKNNPIIEYPFLGWSSILQSLFEENVAYKFRLKKFSLALHHSTSYVYEKIIEKGGECDYRALSQVLNSIGDRFFEDNNFTKIKGFYYQDGIRVGAPHGFGSEHARFPSLMYKFKWLIKPKKSNP